MTKEFNGYRETIIVQYLWLFLIIFCFSSTLHAQHSVLRFKHYTINQGLSQNMIDCIHKDHTGFMWFGTYNGLNRFDGYKFTVFKNDPFDKTSISNNFIYSMCEDNYGNLWLGTANGLNVYLYDQEKFLSYYHTPGEDNTISSDLINSMIFTKDGYIWIGTDNGADKIMVTNNEGSMKVVQHIHPKDQEGELLGSNVISIFEDDEKNIWFGTNDGLTFMDTKKNSFVYYETKFQNEKTLPDNEVHAIYKDKMGDIWIGTTSGISKMEGRSGIFHTYSHNPSNPKSLVHDAIMDIIEDEKGYLIIGTYGGISIYNRKDDNFKNYKQILNVSYSLNNDFVNCLYTDDEGNVWVGTERGGINRYNVYEKNFEFFEHEPGIKNSLNHKIVNSIFEDEEYIWIGTAGGGLNIYDKEKKIFSHFMYDENNPHSISSDFITSIYKDHNNNYWIGSWNGGVNKLTPRNIKKGIFQRYQNSPIDSTSLVSDFVATIIEDQWDKLWIGTLNGLDRFDPATGRFEHFTGESNSKPVNAVGCLQFDTTNNLWVGTMHGLFKILPKANGEINLQSNNIKYFENDPMDTTSISGSYVISICLDKNNDLWFGTHGNGLNKLISDSDKNDKERFESYTETDGLSNNVIYCIIEDDKGNFWMSTDNGISCFNPTEKVFRNFYTSDGLQSNQFYWSSGFKNKKGKIYFGSMNGLNAFIPDEINGNQPILNTYITDFKVFDQSVKVNQEYENRILLDKTIVNTDMIVLSHKLREFSIEFSSLFYNQQEKIQYAYILEGFDHQWSFVEADRRFAMYTNLPGKTYTFKVKARNNEGVWNEDPSTLTIKILPPLWKTWWFIAIAIFLVILILVIFYKIRVRSINQQRINLKKNVDQRTAELSEANALLEEKQEEIMLQNEELASHRNNLEGLVEERTRELIKERKKAEEADRLKSAFLANMSHEIRTPMNAIVGFSNLLLTEENETEKEQYAEIINNNCDNLTVLINDILDISLIEANQLKIDPLPFDALQTLKELESTFKLKTKDEVELKLEIQENKQLILITDQFRFRQILNNLLSNALKYTEKGEIKLGYELKDKSVTFFVSDSGIGIEKNDVAKIFDYFQKIENDTTKLYRGTGIGLSISKKLVDLLGGKIWFESELSKGSTFYFELPLLVETQIKPTKTEEKQTEDKIILNDIQVIIAEDETANYILLEKILKPLKPSISWAKNGEEVVDIVKNNKNLSNAIVIMDIKMPVKNGIDAYHEIRSFNPTIPIVAVTAYATENEKKEIMEHGFTDYISKPVHSKKFIEVVKSLVSVKRSS